VSGNVEGKGGVLVISPGRGTYGVCAGVKALDRVNGPLRVKVCEADNRLLPEKVFVITKVNDFSRGIEALKASESNKS
jgi:hypothetical protein